MLPATAAAATSHLLLQISEEQNDPGRNEQQRRSFRLCEIQGCSPTRRSRCRQQPMDPRSPSRVWRFPHVPHLSPSTLVKVCSLNFCSFPQLPTTFGAKKMLASSLCSSVCTPPSKHAMSCGPSTTVSRIRHQPAKLAQRQDADSPSTTLQHEPPLKKTMPASYSPCAANHSGPRKWAR